MNKLNIKPVISDEIKKNFNNALTELPPGKGTLIGYRDNIESIKENLFNPDIPNSMLLGEPGIGKTALVEQLLFESRQESTEDIPIVAVQLIIESLGALSENVMIARLRELLITMQEIDRSTHEQYPNEIFKIVLWIDEIHKLNNYGKFSGSSGAFNALKEGTARGQFPIIAATTDYEYLNHVASDGAFDRRFLKIDLIQPNKKTVIEILKRKKASLDKKLFLDDETKKIYEYMKLNNNIKVENGFYEELVDLTDAFIRDQVNPAKSLAIFSKAWTHALVQKTSLNHASLVKTFASEGYNIESLTSASQIEKSIRDKIVGQELAVQSVTDAILKSFYTKRDLKKPFLTALFVGTTGTGKTQTVKQIAKGFFGREDAIITINGGDYTDPNSASDAQHFIGDHVAVNKQVVILLDEIEKSHPSVLMSYMRMIDEGIVRDSRGKERAINNTILIATSNLAHETFNDIFSSLELDNVNTDNIEWTPEKKKIYRSLSTKVEKKVWEREERNQQYQVYKNKLKNMWKSKEADLRVALISGNKAENNGLKPEFLERFQQLVPFFGLSKQNSAKIAQAKLKQFIDEEKQLGISVVLPKNKTHEEWSKLFPDVGIENQINTPYRDIDPVSVMIAEDIMGTNKAMNGARTIDRFIEDDVKVKFSREVWKRMAESLPVKTGRFIIDTNGHAKFEKGSENRSIKANIRVIYEE